MTIVIDEDLPRSLGMCLQKIGHGVLDVRDHGLRGAPDHEIFSFAQKNNAVLFSADLGFANILTFPLGSHAGVVVLRFPNEMSTREINNHVVHLLKNVPKTEFTGNLLILAPGQLRLRRKKK